MGNGGRARSPAGIPISYFYLALLLERPCARATSCHSLRAGNQNCALHCAWEFAWRGSHYGS